MPHVAVVEDDPIALELIVDALQGRDYEVSAYTDCASALAILPETPPDLLVSDIDLPDGSGLDLLRYVRSFHPDLPVIMQSGRSSESDLLGGFEAGASDYLTKPISIAELLAKCAVALSRQGQRTRSPDRAGSDLPGGLSRAFGRYRIGEVLGRGGGGVVFSAYDLEEEREVALKALLALPAAGDTQRERFVRETYTLSLLEHPHVVRVLDFGSSEGRAYYTMERVSGAALNRIVSMRGVASPAEVICLLRTLASALGSLHAAGLIHRDVKPGNVMLRAGSFTDPVLIDFGLAKLVEDRSLTQTGVLVGTPGYLSPEQIMGDAPDERSDLFALGLLARYALTGSDPYPSSSMVGLLSKLATRPVPIPLDLPPGLRRVLLRLTQLRPQDRYPNAEALRSDLETL